MPTPVRFLSLCAALLLAACQQAGTDPAPAPPATSAAESAMLESMMLGGFERVEYRNAAGDEIAFEQFMDAVNSGKSFSMDKHLDHSLAVLRINGADRPAQDAVASIATGTPLPAFETLRTLDGTEVTPADLRGRYSLLSFYFSECIPCIAEIPGLNAYAAAHPEIGIWAVTFDDTATSEAFVAQRGLELPVVADAQRFIDSVGIKDYPTWLLVDADGNIAAEHHGGSTGSDAASEADIDAWVRKAMSL